MTTDSELTPEQQTQARMALLADLVRTVNGLLRLSVTPPEIDREVRAVLATNPDYRLGEWGTWLKMPNVCPACGHEREYDDRCRHRALPLVRPSEYARLEREREVAAAAKAARAAMRAAGRAAQTTLGAIQP